MQSFKSGILLKSNDPSIYSNLGVSYYKIKEYEQSLIYYDESIRLNPEDHLVYINKGLSLKALNRLDEALDNFINSSKLQEKYPPSYYYIAII